MVVEMANAEVPAQYSDPTLWLKLVELAGPGFAYLVVFLAFVLCVILIRQFPSLAPYLRLVLPWSPKEVTDTRTTPRVPELIDAEDATEVIEATRRHGEMRILNKIADGENVAVIYIDIDGVIQVFNRMAEQLTGYSESEVVGVNVSILMGATDAKYHNMYVKGYLNEREKGERGRLVGRVRCVTLKHKDGSMIPVKIRLTEISNGIRGFWATMEVNESSTRGPKNA